MYVETVQADNNNAKETHVQIRAYLSTDAMLFLFSSGTG